MTSYQSGYGGVGASPNRLTPTVSNNEIIKQGWASVKEEGFTSWIWAKKYLILRDQTLSLHKSEVSLG